MSGRGSASGLDRAEIPVGGRFWRTLGGNGALLVGYVLLAVHVVVVGVVTAVLGGAARPSYAAGRGLTTLALVSTVLLPLLSGCFLGIGELVRRGRWGGPSRHKPDALLPQGTNTVALRMIPVRWNLAWVGVAGALAALLLRLTVGDVVDYAFGGHLETVLAVNGILTAGIGGAALGALVKKLAWLHGRGARERATVHDHPALARRRSTSLGTRFWRTFSFRWRLDVWLCAFGAVSLWVAGFAFLTREHVPGSDTAALIFGPVGGALVLVGLWATTQFWRSGEDLASGESVS